MRSRMSPHDYLSPEVFEQEQQKIFRKLWLFAGLKTMLPKTNSFVTRKMSGIPVVIQRFDDGIRAFENVCLHRGATLQTTPTGCRPLVCPYHAWSYRPDGSLLNIPAGDQLYRLEASEKSRLKLRSFALREVGNLLFVNLSADPLPLEDQFDAAFLQSLESSSTQYDTEVMVTTWHGRFNWKLAYENLRDANHPRFVHPQSLAKTVDFAPAVDEAQAAESREELKDLSVEGLRAEMKRFSFGGADAPIVDMHRFAWHDRVDRWGADDVYYNWLAFPNLHIASPNGGLSFTLEYHVPIAADRTDIEIYWFSARKSRAYKYSSNVLLAQMHGSKLVVGEDVAVMESVQAALHPDAPVSTQGDYESMNRLVERWYTTVLKGGHGF
ncbi:Rieske 2Fe-2S domain-containing protein [Xylophilus sp. Kf1]|nr:Rieske 2Fe-2S domain-containing protein [Xylophilus sp. Kf1]